MTCFSCSYKKLHFELLILESVKLIRTSLCSRFYTAIQRCLECTKQLEGHVLWLHLLRMLNGSIYTSGAIWVDVTPLCHYVQYQHPFQSHPGLFSVVYPKSF